MDSPGRRVGKCLLSALIAGVYGIVVAEVVANSLVEISITPIFSIVFGVAFFFLSGALIFRGVKSLSETSGRIFMIFFAALVLASGIFSFLLDIKWVHIDWRAKSIMYAIVGLSLAFALSFSFTEFINMGLCDRCCNVDFENNPIIASKKQVVLIFVGTTLLGAIHGLMFGIIDVENDDAKHDKFTRNIIMSIPLGGGIGALIGFVNQWIRSTPEAAYSFSHVRAPVMSINDEI